MDEEIIALEETDEDDAPKKRKKKRVNAFMDGDEDAIDYSDDDPEDEDGYEADPALSYDEENPALWRCCAAPCTWSSAWSCGSAAPW